MSQKVFWGALQPTSMDDSALGMIIMIITMLGDNYANDENKDDAHQNLFVICKQKEKR